MPHSFVSFWLLPVSLVLTGVSEFCKLKLWVAITFHTLVFYQLGCLCLACFPMVIDIAIAKRMFVVVRKLIQCMQTLALVALEIWSSQTSFGQLVLYNSRVYSSTYSFADL